MFNFYIWIKLDNLKVFHILSIDIDRSEEYRLRMQRIFAFQTIYS